MALSVELRPETEARLAAEASASGMELSAFIANLLENLTLSPARPWTDEAVQEWLSEVRQFADRIRPVNESETFSREMIYRDRQKPSS